MEFDAIVYTSKYGHTRQYAEMLGGITGKPVSPLQKGASSPTYGSTILYLGWIRAGRIQGYKTAAKRYRVAAVCGVGLRDAGTQTREVRKVTSIPDDIPLYTLQGGMDRKHLKGADRLLIALLTKGLGSQKTRSPQDERMLALLKSGADPIKKEDLRELLAEIMPGET